MRTLFVLAIIAFSFYLALKLFNYFERSMATYVKTKKEIEELSYVAHFPSAVPKNCGYKLSVMLIALTALCIKGMFFFLETSNPLNMSKEVTTVAGVLFCAWFYTNLYKAESHTVSFLFFTGLVFAGIASFLLTFAEW